MDQNLPEAVQRALTKLCDELCSWERSTGQTSAFVLRMSNGAEFRAASGKPGVPNDVSDELLFQSENCDRSEMRRRG